MIEATILSVLIKGSLVAILALSLLKCVCVMIFGEQGHMTRLP